MGFINSSPPTHLGWLDVNGIILRRLIDKGRKNVEHKTILLLSWIT